jgi:hypothetical protein
MCKWISVFDKMPPVGVEIDVWVRLSSQHQYRAEEYKNCDEKYKILRTPERDRLGYAKANVVLKHDKLENCHVTLQKKQYEHTLVVENYEISHWRLSEGPPVEELEEFARESAGAFSHYLEHEDWPEFKRNLTEVKA